jgi:hypothetical protein
MVFFLQDKNFLDTLFIQKKFVQNFGIKEIQDTMFGDQFVQNLSIFKDTYEQGCLVRQGDNCFGFLGRVVLSPYKFQFY